MQFNSTLFIAVFTLFYAVYFFTAKNANIRLWLLLLAGIGFYAALSTWGIFLLVFIAASDFFIAKSIFSAKTDSKKRALLVLAIFIDVGCLLLWNHFADWFHFTDLSWWPRAIGISFYVFRSLGYVFDVHREIIEPPENKFIHYLTYLAYFPLILMGPIQPARDFLPQLKQGLNNEKIKTGLAVFLIISGILKKYILANYLSINFVNRVFDNAHLFTGLENFLAAVGQALVVYFDFSGYTDLICGISLLLGIEIMANFNFPYISKNITEYWRRWHISLSTWLNNYLYFPLSFALRKYKKVGIAFTVMITFIISGFWHGTKLHYTFWGILHGLALSWDVITGPLRDKIKNTKVFYPYQALSVFLTFGFLALSGVFFKAPTIQSGVEMIQHIFNKPGFEFFSQWVLHYPWVFGIIVASLLLQFILNLIYQDTLRMFEKMPALLLSFLLAGTIFIAYQITGMESLPFIYLEF